jgi:hypothetical protein
MASFVHGGLGIERKASIDFGGNLAGDDFQDLLAEFHQESVKSGINLLIDVATLEQVVLVIILSLLETVSGNLRVSCHIQQRGRSVWRTRVSWRLQG